MKSFYIINSPNQHAKEHIKSDGKMSIFDRFSDKGQSEIDG